MALIERTFIDKIEVTENNIILVREATVIERDGVEISRLYRRKSFVPDTDVTNEDARIRAVATAAWTGAPPPVPYSATPLRIVTRIAFARLFTTAERIAIREAAKTSGPLADFNELLNLADIINLDHPDVTAGLTALTNAGLLAAGRQARILSNQSPV